MNSTLLAFQGFTAGRFYSWNWFLYFCWFFHLVKSEMWDETGTAMPCLTGSPYWGHWSSFIGHSGQYFIASITSNCPLVHIRWKSIKTIIANANGNCSSGGSRGFIFCVRYTMMFWHTWSPLTNEYFVFLLIWCICWHSSMLPKNPIESAQMEFYWATSSQSNLLGLYILNGLENW